MGDGSLSQDEIDALLQGADDIGSMGAAQGPADTGSASGSLSMSDQAVLRDALNGIAGAVAPSLSGYLGGKNLIISNPVIDVRQRDALVRDFSGRFVQISMDYSGRANGKNLVVFKFPDAGVISSLMMGDESGMSPETLTEAHQSTIQEFTNQFLSTVATQFGTRLGGGISTTPAAVSIVEDPSELQIPYGEAVRVTYDFAIQGILTSKLYHFMDAGLASTLVRSGASQQQAQQQFAPQQGQQVGISPVKFPPLDERGIQSSVGDISILLDVPMTLTVELGRTSKLVQEILGLGEGSIIELDKLAGEPVDLLVNGKLIAKGEVVVIDENFGVRVTDIVSPDQRLTSLNG